MSKIVNTRMMILIPIFSTFTFVYKKMIIPIGIPIILPSVNLLTIFISTTLLIVAINEIEITKDNVRLILIASNGANKSNRNGVANMEKPYPVLVCNVEATKIIIINKISSIIHLYSLYKQFGKVYGSIIACLISELICASRNGCESKIDIT